MLIAVDNPHKWQGPILLARALRSLGQNAKAFRGVTIPADFRVTWGFSNPRADLNPRILGDKLRELQHLHLAGVRIPTFSLGEPADGEWLARSQHHRQGQDLIRGCRPYYWVKRLDLTCEFRVHVFRGQSIRLGMKIPGDNAHPWIRSCRHGWRISYGSDAQNAYVSGVRSIAKRAVEALGYDFGAVDVGVGRGAVVLEVNTAPGLDNVNTALAYARHIAQIASGG